jgi:prevent-host-death family protein
LDLRILGKPEVYDKLYIIVKMYELSETAAREKIMERNLGVTEAREKLRELVDQVQHRGEAFIINRHGKPAAAVVPVKVYENWKRQQEDLLEAIRRIQEANKDADPEEVMRDVLEAQKAIRSS